MKLGELFVYYHPSEKKDRNRYYFGAGKIGMVYEDTKLANHRYAEIIDYIPFSKPVGFKRNGEYLEARPSTGTQFFRAVRLISEQAFNKILEGAGIDSEARAKFDEAKNLENPDEVLAYFNNRYRDLEPKSCMRLVSQIDRPSSISQTLKAKLGYKCQDCAVASVNDVFFVP